MLPLCMIMHPETLNLWQGLGIANDTADSYNKTTIKFKGSISAGLLISSTDNGLQNVKNNIFMQLAK